MVDLRKLDAKAKLLATIFACTFGIITALAAGAGDGASLQLAGHQPRIEALKHFGMISLMIQKGKHLKWMLVLLYPTHYVKMCSRCSILLSHSLLESAHSFSSVSISAFIGRFFL